MNKIDAYNDVLAREIKKVARSVAFEWPGVTEADDIEQEIWLHITERPNTWQDLWEMDDIPRYQTLSKIGHRIASRERTDYDYFTGNFRYAVNEVKKLLVSGALDEVDTSIQSGWTTEEYTSKGGEFEDAILARCSVQTDLHRGMEKLSEDSPRYYDILVRKYVNGEYLSTGADKQRASAALTSLTDAMNSSFKRQHADRPEGPGTRKAVPNAAAQAISSTDYYHDERSSR